MIGQYIDGKGWEILCDNLGLFLGYVQGTHSPTSRTIKPSDKDYEVFCQELFYIDKIGDIITLNNNEVTPTNTIIPYAFKEVDRICIELDEIIYDCYLLNTYLNGEFPQTLDNLYNGYLELIGQ